MSNHYFNNTDHYYLDEKLDLSSLLKTFIINIKLYFRKNNPFTELLKRNILLQMKILIINNTQKSTPRTEFSTSDSTLFNFNHQYQSKSDAPTLQIKAQALSINIDHNI